MVPQTDQEWLERLASAAPHELSEAEIAALREQIAASPELRAAVVEHLRMDQLLAHALGPIDLSADQIIDRANRAARKPGRSVLALFGLAAAILIFLGVGAWIARDTLFGPHAAGEVASVDKDGNPIDTTQPGDNGDTKHRTADVTNPGDADPNDPNKVTDGNPADGKSTDPPIRIEVTADKFVRGNVVVDDFPSSSEKVFRESGGDETPWVEYEVETPKAGDYNLRIRHANYWNRGTLSPLSVSINGEVVRPSAATDLSKTLRWSDESIVKLVEGKNVIRFESRINPLAKKPPSIARVSQFALIEDRDAAARAAKAEAMKPWQEANQLGGPPRPFEQVAFEDFLPNDDGLSGGELSRWLCVDKKFEDLAYIKSAQFAGSAKFRPEWPEDAALRLSLNGYGDNFRMQFWHGTTGMELRFYNALRQVVVYSVEAKPVKAVSPPAPPKNGKPSEAVPAPAVKLLSVLATDDDRFWRTYPQEITTFDIRCQQGKLVLSRGDVRMLSVPFEGQPDAVYFDGKAAVRQISFIHSPGLPPTTYSERRPPVDLDPPAKLAWINDLPAGAKFDLREDGAVELKAEKIPQSAWKAFKLPTTGPYEIIAELDDLRPGARIFLGNAAGQPQYTVGFMQEKRTGSLSAGFLNPADTRWESEYDTTYYTAPLVSKHLWVRLVYGAGTLKLWTSPDGTYWSHLNEPLPNLEGPYATFGIGCSQGDAAQQITLRKVAIRPLDVIQSLVPEAAMKSAVAVKEAQIVPWRDAVAKQQPAGADPAVWQRACAIRTLAGGTNKSLGNQLLDSLVDDALEGAMPPEKWFDLLDDVSLMYDAWGNPEGAMHLQQLYERVGQIRYRSGDLHPFSVVSSRLMNAPIGSIHRPNPDSKVLPSVLIRPEVYELVYGHQTDDIRSFGQLLRFWNRDDPLLASVETRGGRTGVKEAPTHIKGKYYRPTPPVDRRHPLIEELSKEGYNLMAEFEAAVASHSYKDACELIANLSPSEVQGLLPHANDTNLLITLSTEVESAMRDYPDLRKTMFDDYGPIAALRLKQAMIEGDALTISALGIQFQGTSAAAEAHLWLGDRALSDGDAQSALEHYRLADRAPSENVKAVLAAHRRLASAWLGKLESDPLPDGAKLTLGDRQLTGSEFEQLVSELQKRTPSRTSVGPLAANLLHDPAPTPSGYDAQRKEELKGEYGNPNADGVDMAYPGANSVFTAAIENRNGDFSGRQFALTLNNDLLLASNRYELWAYDAKSGQKRWQATAKTPAKPWMLDWPLTPMRPLAAGDRIFVRQLVRPSPVLACLDRNNGNQVWVSTPNICMASDPVIVQDRLLALTCSQSDQTYTLSLTSLDAATGSVISQTRLFDMRRTWWTQRTCQLTATDGSLTAVCGANVFRCDLNGNVQWIRRQDWFSDGEDKSWINQFQEPPLVRGDKVYATQPGVHCIEAIDAETGKLAWRKVLPTIHRICDLIDDRLIAETDDGLVGLDAKTGQAIWYYDARGMLTGQLCGGAGKLACFFRQVTAPESPEARPRLLWIDPATGKATAAALLDGLKYPNVQIGPVVMVGDHIWGLIGKNEGNPLPVPNRELFELTPNGPPILPKANAAN